MNDSERTAAYQPHTSEAPAVEAAHAEHPHRIGRYRIERVLGEGGFGLVYLAHDEQLHRLVAIKVPHPHLVAQPSDAEAYLMEARTVANLDHPHIVPVYDVGSSQDHPCFVVSKFIEGSTLAQCIKTNRPSVAEAAEMVATVAETLHYAHEQGIVHRDVKPGNILLDSVSKPFVADFGLALREQDVGTGARFAGTPAYMSPEQARGEGHRVDGRSDLFSLGVVFYELLTGKRPFKADTVEALLEQIIHSEVRPPRQWENAIPKELERICLKALSKRASDRYTTGKDLADDLRLFFQQTTQDERASLRSRSPTDEPPSPIPASRPVPTFLPTPTSDQQPVKIVPKGLRSFDAQDADFFLELLPGPRDREGLPDSIRFWKTRIEERDGDNTFAVGLIYGPSGCGKSSLVKAGLLPRLSQDVIAVHVEATAEETETRLLNGLRKRCPGLPANVGLKETLATLRRGQGISGGQKVLIVLDQFEQWLHAKKEEENTVLVQALRQCEGSRVQCVVMVRDDFWLAVSRFVRDLEVDLVPGRNVALADLFDLDHARKVLTAFGRAFGRLPEKVHQTSKEQQEFVKQAIAGLSQDKKVICVRLSLFAEMMKGRAWNPATLKEVGGTEGVGVTFLEDTFSSPTANPKHRLHQKAARSVLQMLLPDSGSDIKGLMRSHQELLGVSGYSSRPREFDELLRILDGELRLITPTDPEGKEGIDDSASQVQRGQKYYQLTHDYLVPSLRDWLTRKQKETRRGRAELLLVDRSAVWNGRPENRQLPSLWQWVQIKWLTAKKNWTPPQRKMMRKAGRYHVMRAGVLFAFLAVLGWSGWEVYGRLEGRRLRDRLLEATTADVPAIVEDMASYRRWVNPLLNEAYAQAERENDPRKQLHASVALLPVDSRQVEYLFGRLLKGQPQEALVIREVLAENKQDLQERLWRLLENRKNDQDERLRAACALAAFAPDDPRWEKISDDVAATLVIQKPFVIAQWADALKGVGHRLIPSLADFLVDEKRSLSERGLIASVYGKYAADAPDAYARLEKGLTETSGPDATAEAKETLAKKQASLGIALIVMGQGEKAWPLLKHSPDPTVRSYLIERLGPGGVDAKVLSARLEEEKEVSIRRALLLSLGEYGPDRVPPAERQNLLPRIVDLYRRDADPGIHGAARWHLKKWEAVEKIEEVDKASRVASAPGVKRGWSVNSEGQTMMLIPKPHDGLFWMGKRRERHQQQMGHDFVLSSEDVSVEQFQRFRAEYKPIEQFAPTKDCPAIVVSWYDAAAYCNWLSKREGIAESQWCYEIKQGAAPALAASTVGLLASPLGAGPLLAAALVFPERSESDTDYGNRVRIKAGYLGLRGYRLPTEAEWEYACRAGSTVGYSFGEPVELLVKYGWFNLNSLSRPHPCGKLKPNDLGLFDIHGNVWQWTNDAWINKIESKEVDGGELLQRASNRVYRGGSWIVDAGYCRAASRLWGTPGYRDVNLGFRLARVPVAGK